MANYGHQEMVMLFNSDGEIAEELHLSEFNDLVAGEWLLPECAASQLKAGYCVVGRGLQLEGIVFFLLSVDEQGQADSTFNLPLRYLVQQAGFGGELSHGLVRKASRGQCPVPWHSMNLWEPAEEEILETIQQRIFRNKLNLKSVLQGGINIFADVDKDPGIELIEEALDTEVAVKPLSQQFAERLDQTFGQNGRLSVQDMVRLHAEQLSAAQSHFRDEVEKQQSTYLDQLRAARDEIHELKVALRQEQSRNRRLQQMLRGDP